MKAFLSFVTTLFISIYAIAPMSAFAAGTENPVPAAKQAVVFVLAGVYFDADGNGYTYDDYYYSGTAFGVGESGSYAQTFVTNCHVVSDSKGKVYDFVYICIDDANIYDESTLIKCNILYTDSDIDIAVIQADAPIVGVTTLPLLPAETMQSGEHVYALGFPGIADVVADSNNYTVEDITVTDGIISRYLTSDGRKCMAHMATINHGNSGGPLINDYGQVIGINTFGYTEYETADTRGYAIYIDYAMDALDQLDIEYTRHTKVDEGSEATPEPTTEPTTEPTAEPTERPIEEDESVPILVVVGVSAAVVIIVAAIAVIVIIKTRKPAQKKGNSSENASVRTDSEKTYSICVVKGPMQGRRWQLSGSLVIGRDPAGDIVYPSSTAGISRNHCRIDLRGGMVVLTDLGSTYGTYVDGRKLNAHESVVIGQNTVMSLGSQEVQLALL